MPTARSATPVAISDTSSDGGSLSDLDSGWTDLEIMRSNGRRSPSTTSEAGDSEDAKSAIDRLDAEKWEVNVPENAEQGDIDNNTFSVKPSSTSVHAQPLSLPPEVPELVLEDWVADAVGSSVLFDDETPTPHMSFHSSSSPLRLSFPDPLSSSDHDLLPSHSLSRARSQSVEGSHGVRSHSPARTESLSSVTARSASATTPSDTSFSVQDEDEEQREETDYELPSVELAPPAVSYALSIILVGHPPLPHLKRTTMSTVIDMVATVLNGSPRILEGSDTARFYEVPIYVPQPKSIGGSVATSTHRIIIEDRTSGMSPSSSFTSLHCPTLVLVFIQPPLSTPSLPSLPFNTRYLPLLLPSISDGFASSLLDLSPSTLFEHSVPNVPAPDITAMKSFALHQCDEMKFNGSRLDGSKEVLTVEEFSRLPTDEIFSALRDVLFPPEEATKETLESNNIPVNTGGLSNIPTFRKPIIFISAFLFAFLLGSTFFRSPPPLAPQSEQQSTRSPQGQKLWSFMHPFISRIPGAQVSSTRPAPVSQEPSSVAQSSETASSMTWAVSVVSSNSIEAQGANTAASKISRSERGKGKPNHPADFRAENNRHEVRPITIGPAVPHLTIDAASPKSLPLLPRTPLHTKADDKAKAVDTVSDAHNPLPSTTTTSLSTRISNALSPLFDRFHTDIREIQEAIDALLQALWHLQKQTSHGVGGLVRALSEEVRTGQGVQGLAGKVHRVAQCMSETASKRHARARYNARKVRDISERYVSAARESLKKNVEKARGNARLLKEGLAFANSKTKLSSSRERRKAARATRAWRTSCKRNGGCSEYVFESVMALVM